MFDIGGLLVLLVRLPGSARHVPCSYGEAGRAAASASTGVEPVVAGAAALAYERDGLTAAA
jgi:hypothetical protein